MIGYINGLIIDKNEKALLILAQSVGYEVFVPTGLLAEAVIDKKIQLYIHTAVKEDDISLYGFSKKEELTFFKQLISVSGIGPKMALDILSTPLHITQNAILSGDAAMLTKIKGLGKKTAERLIIELKNKIVPVTLNVEGESASPLNEDAILALESLGYEKFQIMKAISEMPGEITETEEIVKYFLKTSS